MREFTINAKKSIIPSLDVSTLEGMNEIVSATHDLQGIGGYKIGFSLGLRFGLPKVMQQIRDITQKPVIYDHQKGATDIPDTAKQFAEACAEAGVTSVIYYPQSGPQSLKKWIEEPQKQGLGVIVGTEMTHPGFLKSEGGFIDDQAPFKMLEIALEMGVTEFAVPGNKPQKILEYRKLIEQKLAAGKYSLYSPGLVAQGGEVSESARAAGERWHAIIGRAIYGLNSIEEMRRAAENYSNALEGE